MKEKIIIMPLTEFRQNITSLWKKINEDNLTFLITVKGRPVLKITKYEKDVEIDIKNNKNKNIIKNQDIKTDSNKSNCTKINKKDNIDKKWGGYKSVIGEIDWDNLL